MKFFLGEKDSGKILIIIIILFLIIIIVIIIIVILVFVFSLLLETGLFLKKALVFL